MLQIKQGNVCLKESVLNNWGIVKKDLGNDLKNMVCPILPANMLDGCNDFVTMYGQAAVKLTVAQVSADQLCTAIHACEKKDGKI